MPLTDIRYREAVPSDAFALAAFGSAAFVDAYGHALRPADLVLHVARAYGEAQQLAELQDPHSWTLLADREGEIVAAALLRWAEPPPGLAPELPWAELARFYVARVYWETGVSSELMVAVLRSIRSRGGQLVWLQVWERAERAIRFYRKWGFFEVGEAPYTVGRELQRDLVLARSLAARVT
jgi:GNAT superfamily N-acetyltransferase